MRLSRYLAQAGVASRRAAEDLITGGKVRVNGRLITELGSQVDPERDQVSVAGQNVMPETLTYLLLHKPVGYVTTLSDPQGRPTIADLIPAHTGARLYPVGRLDYNTEGLLLLTNDGDLTQALLHPSKAIEKVYHVKIKGIFGEDLMERLRVGVRLEDGRAKASRVTLLGTTGKYTWVELVITEGRNRQIHRMIEAVGHRVQRLKRVGFANLSLIGLKPGMTRVLEDGELRALLALTRLEGRRRVSSGPSRKRSGFAAKEPGRGDGKRGAPTRARHPRRG